jgi:hypothetical protein
VLLSRVHSDPDEPPRGNQNMSPFRPEKKLPNSGPIGCVGLFLMTYAETYLIPVNWISLFVPVAFVVTPVVFRTTTPHFGGNTPPKT